ncbi:MAG TPA: DUF308 domain-containing protein [Gemmatimonadaceae bacterium]|nr:DUF308 domain-containing protein [Gemmatimonadaceae bacterium]
MTPYRAVDLFSRSQLVRGLVLAQLGIAAINWPEVALPTSMAVAGALVALSGAYDVYVGAAARRSFRAWPVFVGHGAACVGFGLLTFALPRMAQSVAMFVVAIWLIAYGMMTTALAMALWPMPRTRWTLLGVTIVFVPLGLFATTLGDMPEFVPLYLGAFFAVFLGVLHLTAGLWLRRIALPYFAPTTQAAWAPPVTPTDAHPRVTPGATGSRKV